MKARCGDNVGTNGKQQESREDDSRDFMCLRINVLKNFMMMDLIAVGWWSVRQDIEDIFSLGTTGELQSMEQQQGSGR